MDEDDGVRIYRIPKWVGLRILSSGVLFTLLGIAMYKFGNDFRYRLPIFFFPLFLWSSLILLVEGVRGLVTGWNINLDSLVVSEEGIRNLDPARPNVILWEDIASIRPRPFWRRLEASSSLPFKPIRIPFLIQNFDEVASQIVLKSQNVPTAKAGRFEGASFNLWSHINRWILLSSLFGVCLVGIMTKGELVFGKDVSNFLIPAVIPLLTLSFQYGYSALPHCYWLRIDPNLVALSTSNGEPRLLIRHIEEIRLTTVKVGFNGRELNVKVRMQDGSTHHVSPRGVNPIDVFYSVHAAWEKYKETIDWITKGQSGN